MPKRVKPEIDGMRYECAPIQKAVFLRSTGGDWKKLWRKLRGKGHLG